MTMSSLQLSSGLNDVISCHLKLLTSVTVKYGSFLSYRKILKLARLQLNTLNHEYNYDDT